MPDLRWVSAVGVLFVVMALIAAIAAGAWLLAGIAAVLALYFVVRLLSER